MYKVTLNAQTIDHEKKIYLFTVLTGILVEKFNDENLKFNV